MTKLFDSLIKPILLYCSEIWGVSSKPIHETFHNKFCKSLLGLNKSASTSAVLGDLGRYPMQIFIDIFIVKYWIRIANNTCRQLVSEAYISELNQNEPSKWILYVKNLLCKHGFLYVWQNPTVYHPDIFLENISERILKQYEYEWSHDIENNKKLNMYKCIKSEFGKEKYLHLIKNIHLRKSMSRLRISCHTLCIETGRHKKPPIPRDQRLCKVCKVLEDEPHFLVSCKKYEASRHVIFSHVKSKTFKYMSQKDKYICLMTSTDPTIIMLVAEFIKKCLFT